MLDNGTYHLLDSLVTPSVDEDLSNKVSFLRLENICACTIARNKRNCQILSKTPKHLHKILWESYLKDEYYAHIDSLNKYEKGDLMVKYFEHEGSLNKIIPELLYHWPYEEFILKEVIPKFPPRLNSFSSFWDPDEDGPYHNYSVFLFGFFKNLLDRLYDTFLKGFMGDLPEHNKACKIRRINLSGFKNFELGAYEDTSFITEEVENYKPFFKYSSGKLEVIFDVELPCGPIRDMEYLEKLEYTYSNSSSPVVLKFGHVTVFSFYYNSDGSRVDYEKKDITKLIEKLVNNGAESICLNANTVISSEKIEKVLENITCQDNIKSIKLENCASKLNFTNYFKNLVHLDLAGNDLHGRVDRLLYVGRGLLLLNLRNCSLTNVDLAQLIDSFHLSTLRELNLSNNLLSCDNSCNNLIMLCKNLTKVQLLDLGYCKLASWQSNEIKLLIHSLMIMPNIVNLILRGNIFSMDTVTVDMMVLHENPSLRYLEICLPRQINNFYEKDENDIVKSFCFNINAKMNNNRLQLLYVDFAGLR
ncbi:unnamed protein product [Meganyctiphanes norvegica]|uniref:Uncharacterized protein n=1 Tax=Meganyctiphanes norvegica TaxID=48144 RepID=A0AAV2PSK2_MEGNR